MTQRSRIPIYYILYHQNGSFYNYSNDISKLFFRLKSRYEFRVESIELRYSINQRIHNSKQSMRYAINTRSPRLRHKGSLHQYFRQQRELSEKSNSIQIN